MTNHPCMNKNMTKKDLHTIEKFLKRKGRPNTGIPYKKRFGDALPNQSKINEKRLEKCQSYVKEMVN